MRSPNFGGVRGIRTLGTLLTYTRFPVVLVMTASISLHLYLSAAIAPASAWPGHAIKPFYYSVWFLFCQLLFSGI